MGALNEDVHCSQEAPVLIKELIRSATKAESEAVRVAAAALARLRSPSRAR